jgi:hypothetical protein
MIINTEQELASLPVETLVDIIKELNCKLQVFKPFLNESSFKNKMRKCKCCNEFCCIKVL